MEEKERYYYDGLGEDIYDSEIDDYPSNEIICATLNQQDKRIRELEQQIKKYENCLILDYNTMEWRKFSDIQWEIKELKQSQKQLAIEELEKIKNYFDDNIEIENDISALKLEEFYNNQIKSLKGEE